MEHKYDLLMPGVPLVFTDGTSLYDELKKKYVTHRVGYFILAPSGAGKTHFVNGQIEPHWIDGDHLWMSAHAHPDSKWWLEPVEIINEIDSRSDVITVEAKKMGFWIVGASNYWLKPDAIVIPHWKTHKKYISVRETTHYDGGATSDKLHQVQAHRRWISKWAKKGVPSFKSVDEAASHLAEQIK